MPAACVCGLANGLQSVTVVTPSTCGHDRACPDDGRVFPDRPLAALKAWLTPGVCGRFFSRLVLALGLGLAGVGATAADAAARNATEAVRAPEMAGSHDDLIVRSTVLEREQRWADVVSLCETAARKGALAPELQQRYDLAKIHCDLSRRHCEQAFRTQLGKLAETDARRLYAEVLSRIGSHHVEAPQFARLVARGCRTMDVAIDDPTFVSLYVQQASPERRVL